MVTTGRLAGDVIDVKNMSDCLFHVNSNTIDLSQPYYQLDSLNVSYDGKTLEFSEIATPDITNPSFAPENTVQLQFDFGSGMTTYFYGKIRRRTRVGKNNAESISYVAVGQQTLANEVVLKGPTGVPFLIYEAYTIPHTINGIVFYGTPINSIVTSIFTLCISELNTLGISSTIGNPSADVLGGLVQESVTFENKTFVDAVGEMLQKQPDRKIFYDDTTGTWVFPSLLTSDIVTITINSVNIGEFTYTEDLTGRYTALKVMAAYEGSIPVDSKQTVILTEDWDAGLEDSWCLQAAGVNDPAGFNTELLKVFRQYKIPDAEKEINTRAPVCIYAVIDFWSNAKYIPVDAQIDFATKTVVTNVPLVLRGNVFHPDKNKIKPDAVVLTYSSTDSMPTLGFPSIRVPAAGYEGTAFDLYGFEKEKVELIDSTLLYSANAYARLSLLKDVIIAGDLEIEGDPIQELLNLQYRVCVNHVSKTTGLETIAAVVNSYTYEFGRRGRNKINLSTDRSGLVWVQ